MKVPWGYLKRLTAGATFGLYMAHLLYILNPQIEITPARLAVVTFLYGVICALLFGSLLWLLRVLRVRLFGRPGAPEERRHGFGLVVLATFFSAAVYLTHLMVFRIYLPIGAVRILSIATNLLGGTAFALLLLWFIERNASLKTSRVIFFIGIALIALSSFFLYQRRDRYRADTRSVVVANVGTVAGARAVILVTIRGLPHDWLLTMIGEGSLPFFTELTKSPTGYLTRIEPFTATSPKALWASLATGQLPHRHGVTGRFSYVTALNAPGERFLLLPHGVGFRAWGLIPPVKRISAQLPAGDSLPLWQPFERVGLRTLVISWPATSPARSSASAMVSDRFFETAGAGEFSPPSLAPALAGVRPAPGAVAAKANVLFGPLSGTRGAQMRKGVTSDLASEGALDALAPRGPFALTAVSLNGLAEVLAAQRVGNELPPRSEPAGVAVRSYLDDVDAFLRRLKDRNPGALIVVASPSATVPPRVPATVVDLVQSLVDTSDPGSDDGFLAITGPGVARRENAASAQVVDVVPTILFAAGLPVARDMDGKVQTDAFDDAFLREHSLSMIETYQASRLLVRRPAPGAGQLRIEN